MCIPTFTQVSLRSSKLFLETIQRTFTATAGRTFVVVKKPFLQVSRMAAMTALDAKVGQTWMGEEMTFKINQLVTNRTIERTTTTFDCDVTNGTEQQRSFAVDTLARIHDGQTSVRDERPPTQTIDTRTAKFDTQKIFRLLTIVDTLDVVENFVFLVEEFALKQKIGVHLFDPIVQLLLLLVFVQPDDGQLSGRKLRIHRWQTLSSMFAINSIIVCRR